VFSSSSSAAVKPAGPAPTITAVLELSDGFLALIRAPHLGSRRPGPRICGVAADRLPAAGRHRRRHTGRILVVLFGTLAGKWRVVGVVRQARGERAGPVGTPADRPCPDGAETQPGAIQMPPS